MLDPFEGLPHNLDKPIRHYVVTLQFYDDQFVDITNYAYDSMQAIRDAVEYHTNMHVSSYRFAGLRIRRAVCIPVEATS